jgi:hypothetical protein
MTTSYSRQLPKRCVRMVVSLSLIGAAWGLTRSASAQEEGGKPPSEPLNAVIRRSAIAATAMGERVRCVHAPHARQLQFSTDNSVLYSSAENVRLWDAATGDHLGSFPCPVPIDSMALLQGGTRVVTVDEVRSGSRESFCNESPTSVPRVRLWDTATGRQIARELINFPADASFLRLNDLVAARDGRAVFCIASWSVTRPDDLPASLMARVFCFSGDTLERRFVTDVPGLDSPEYVFESRDQSHVLLVQGSSVYVINTLTGKLTTRQTIGGKQHGFVRIDPATWSRDPAVLQAIRPTSSGDFLRGAFDLGTGEYFEGDLGDDVARWATDPMIFPSSSDRLMWSVVLDPPRLELWDALDGNVSITMQIPADALEVRRQLMRASLTETFQTKRYCPGDYQQFATAVDSKNQRVAVAFADDEAVYLLDVVHQKLIARPQGTVAALSADTSDQRVAVASDGERVAVLNQAGQEEASLDGTGVVTSVCLTAAKNRLALGLATGHVRMADLTAGRLFEPHHCSGQPIDCIRFFEDLNCLYLVDRQGVLRRADVDSEGGDWTIDVPRNGVLYDVSDGFVSTGREPDTSDLPYSKLATIAEDERTVMMYALRPNPYMLLGWWPPSRPHSGAAPGSDLSATLTINRDIHSKYPDCKIDQICGRVAVITSEPQVTFEFAPNVPPEVMLRSIRATADGQHVIFAFGDGRIVIAGRVHRECEAVLQTGRTDIVDCVYLPHRRKVALVTVRGRVELWDVDDAVCVQSEQLDDCHASSLVALESEQEVSLCIGTRDAAVKWCVFK